MMTEQDIQRIAEEAAKKAIAESLVESSAFLVLYVAEHEATGGGKVIDATRARATPCGCFIFEGDEYCWSPGVLGLISSKKNPEQMAEFCVAGKTPAGVGAQERFRQIKGAIAEAHSKWQEKGGGLPEWWAMVGEKLAARGVEL